MHLAFVSPAGYGHVNPTLPLVGELIARGHRVTYATGATLLPRVEPTGAATLALPTELPADPRSLIDFSDEGLSTMLGYWLDGARADLSVLIDHFRHFRADPPDAICYDFSSFTGRILAQQRGVPAITVCPTFAGHENFSYLQRLLPKNFDPANSPLADFTPKVHALAAEFGVHTDPGQPAFGWPAPLNLVFLPKQFQLSGDTFDARFRFIGPSLGARAWTESWAPPEFAERVAYVTLGTLFNDRPDFFRTCARAFAGTDWHVVIALGFRVRVEDIGPLPNNVEAGPYLPQSAILRHSAVSISHAGMNTTMDALYFGVPLVTVPDTPEQRLNAARVEELGLGRQLPATAVSAELLRDAVEQVVDDPAIRARAARMRALITECGGAAAGAAAIEQHLNGSAS